MNTLLTLYLSTKLLCSGTECYPVAIGPDTYKAVGQTFPITQYRVPIKDQAKYGRIWFQIGDDEDWGIHSYPNWHKFMISHGCIRISNFHLNYLVQTAPTHLEVKP
jgi:hypothetical protein